MASHFPIVFEQEDSGAYSAYVAGLPVYAQGRTRAQAGVQSFERCVRISRPIHKSSRGRKCRSRKWRPRPTVLLGPQ